jgi:cytochrome c551/c552
MKKLLSIPTLFLFLYACSSGPKTENKTEGDNSSLSKMMDDTSQYAPDEKGIGKFKDIQVDPKLDEKMAAMGLGVYDLKCSSCHKLTDEKLVGPGWKNVTSRRKAEWVMNFVTNTDEMLTKDPEAQAMLEVCLVRMPNQSLSDEDARSVYEFMRKNDGVK